MDEKIEFSISNLEKLQIRSMLKKYGLRKMIFIISAESGDIEAETQTPSPSDSKTNTGYPIH
jgi:hypothetical protein